MKLNHLFFKVCFIVFAFTANHSALAQSSAYPNRPIKIINPLPPGGAVDAMARMLAPQLQEILGQPIVIENKSGAGGTIGANFVAKAPADGYTILIVYDTFAVNPHVYKNLPFDTFNDLIPITELVKIPLVLVSTTKLPANNLKELVALSKIKPNGVNYSSGGSGSSGHLAGELISKSLGLRSTHIPYKGGGPALTAAISGEVDFTILGVVITAPQIKGNNLKPLSILGKKRTPALPETPTASEQGLLNFDVSSWIGILAPAGTPPAIIDKLNFAFSQAMKNPTIVNRMNEQGNEIISSSPTQFGMFIKEESSKWARIIKESNIQID